MAKFVLMRKIGEWLQVIESDVNRVCLCVCVACLCSRDAGYSFSVLRLSVGM